MFGDDLLTALYLHESERHDLRKFAGFLRNEKKQSPRSAYNKFEIVTTFLKANRVRGLIGKNDRTRWLRQLSVPPWSASK